MTKKDRQNHQANITRKVLENLCELGYITKEECFELKRYTYGLLKGKYKYDIITSERSFSLVIEDNLDYCDLGIDLYVDDLKYVGTYNSQNNGVDFRILDNSIEVGEFFIDFN